ncbi:MAG: leucine-rich repeat domain-containing protein [Prevotella pallens]|uniref:leucine-rich repeat domain-containing protein n=1 Tax=Prevotella pallens TaxID=60133 RepID=UPI001CAF098D|nr:leucine-rich repeat domain-containing protein [Prevotella pallens]MBF1488793.1 leucine-rich repeat domain-containing protein [Prevotella pallens]
MKRILLFLLPFVLSYSQKMYGQVHFFDANVSKYGELEQVLGDKWDKFDSLIVHGPINKADFKTIVRCATDGSMQVVNLQYAQIENNKIPNSGFVDWGWQKPGYHLGIRRIILPDNITEFGEFAFYGLTLETINIPSSLRKLGNNCFDENRWLSVNPLIIPEGVTEIPTQCFQFCYKLKKVVLPSTIKTIGIFAFFDSSVDDMNFPEGLDSIGYLSMHGTRLTEVVLPKTIRTIGYKTFASNFKLKKVVLPEGLTEIPDNLCSSCIELEKIVIPESVIKINTEAFSACLKLKTNLPPKLKWIGSDAFSSSGLDSIVFPATMEYIGKEAFQDLTKLKKIYSMSPIPPVCYYNTMVNFGDGPFGGSTPSDIPVYVPIGSGEKYREAFGWNYFTKIIETDKFPTGIVLPKMGNNELCKVYGKGNELVIEIPNLLSSPIHYSIYSIDGTMIEQGNLIKSYTLRMPAKGVYIVRVGNTTHKIFM